MTIALVGERVRNAARDGSASCWPEAVRAALAIAIV